MSISNLAYSYDKKTPVLSGINLDVSEGWIIGLAGHNGAGKTTLLRLVCGLLKQDSGLITRDSLLNQPGKVSFVPDSGGFYTEISAIQNMQFRYQLAGRSKDFSGEAKMLLKAVDLYGKRDERVITYSHGMRKRLAIACACISNPKLLLLDESFNGIDPESRDSIIRFLKTRTEKKASILISTHDLNLIDDLCDRLVILQHGSIVYNEEVSQSNQNSRSVYREIMKKEKLSEEVAS